jgi:hypothetical protein
LEIAQRGKSRGCFGDNRKGIKGGKGMKKYKVLQVISNSMILKEAL